jgi:nicotinate-nucleotide adenylyltransferase
VVGLIGVFGGTFDPPHLGHLILADEGRWVLGLEKVLWVVTGVPPHKPDWPVSPVEARVAMVQAAIAGDPYFELSPADIDRPGPHYAVGTIEWLAERRPGATFAYLMGADSLRDLPGWHEPDRLIQACQVLGIMRRPEVELDMVSLMAQLPALARKVRFIDAPVVGFSGREIRRRVREGIPFRHLVPREVERLIREKGLYLEGA